MVKGNYACNILLFLLILFPLNRWSQRYVRIPGLLVPAFSRGYNFSIYYRGEKLYAFEVADFKLRKVRHVCAISLPWQREPFRSLAEGKSQVFFHSHSSQLTENGGRKLSQPRNQEQKHIISANASFPLTRVPHQSSNGRQCMAGKSEEVE